ncbi:hypothetical protein KIL84_010980 [Mauremys mutica]|uniref:Uncharacterized protein n=1 Tax=Mauremys mutica TaxID=74926 RepID=A0A9D3XDD2_9SAUR|nr:hypothetical protein KIL84_010980 [Mauremys mutica]
MHQLWYTQVSVCETGFPSLLPAWSAQGKNAAHNATRNVAGSVVSSNHGALQGLQRVKGLDPIKVCSIWVCCLRRCCIYLSWAFFLSSFLIHAVGHISPSSLLFMVQCSTGMQDLTERVLPSPLSHPHQGQMFCGYQGGTRQPPQGLLIKTNRRATGFIVTMEKVRYISRLHSLIPIGNFNKKSLLTLQLWCALVQHRPPAPTMVSVAHQWRGQKDFWLHKAIRFQLLFHGKEHRAVTLNTATIFTESGDYDPPGRERSAKGTENTAATSNLKLPEPVYH